MQLSLLWSTSVGRKYLVSVTGLLFSGFVLGHMAGNLLLFAGPEMYNKYSYALTSNPLLYAVEVVLLAIFVTHFGLALSLAVKNRKARPVRPDSHPPIGNAKRAPLASRTMVYSGLLTLAFVVLHLWTFKYGTHYEVTYGTVTMRDIYRLVAEKFREPLYVGWYVLCMALLAGHLSHGLGATLQSLGFTGIREGRVQSASRAIAWIICAGFAAQPLFFFFGGGQ